MEEQEATPTPQVQTTPSYWRPLILVRPPYDELAEPRSADVLWDVFSLLIGDPDRAQQDNKSLSDTNIAAQYAGFIRQAKSYWDAAATVRDSAAALLYYYCFLNLAKAELLPFRVAEIEADPQHGLSMRPSQQDNVFQARVKIERQGPRKQTPQIFEMLYQKRTAQAWPSDIADIAVADALRRVPEIGFEMGKLGHETVLCFAYHAITFDEQFNGRSDLLLHHSAPVKADAHVWAKLTAVYEETPLFQQWRNVFALSPRVSAQVLRLRSREAHGTRVGSDPNFLQGDLGARYWTGRIWDELAGIVDVTGDTTYDGFLLPSLIANRPVPLLMGLARYIAFYYMSELVRYRPSALDPVRKPKQTWLLGAFARQAALPLLHDFYNHMSTTPLIFQGSRA